MPQGAGAGVEQGDDLGHGEPAPGPRVDAPPEGTGEFGVVRHAHPGAVREPSPVPAPGSDAVGPGPGRLRDPAQQRLAGGQGEPGAGLAVGRRGEGAAGQAGEVGAGGVAVQDLEDEQVDRGDRVEYPLAPAVPGVPARLADGVRGERAGEIPADLTKGFGEGVAHVGPQEFPKARLSETLWLNCMPFTVHDSWGTSVRAG